MALPTIFDRGAAIPQSERARADAKTAADLKKRFLTPQYTSEVYGPTPDFATADDTELMPNPDEAEQHFGTGTGSETSVYDQMAKNVAHYAALREGRIDVATSLPLTWLVGKKGDPESEAARNEVESAWEEFSERSIWLRAACKSLERGFSGGENIFDFVTRGAAKGMVSIVAIIDRPNNWFAFDYRRQPYLRRSRTQPWKGEPIPPYKVMFARSGSLHTNYGRGYGPEAFPTVWAMDAMLKGYAKMAERFGYMPIVAEYPNSWGTLRVQREINALKQHWKNVIPISSDLNEDKIKITLPTTDAAYAAANASGRSRLEYVAKLEQWLAMSIQGSNYSAGNQQEGSYARDQVASGDRLWKAPSDAAVIEAMLNRGFVEPMMIVNRPTIEREKWPRCSIDSSAGEDLEMLLRIFESGAKHEIPISAVTWSERFKIPLAQEGEPILGTGVSQPMLPAADPNADPLADAAVRMSEQLITVRTPTGKLMEYRPDQWVWTKKRGRIRAAALQNDDVLVDDPQLRIVR